MFPTAYLEIKSRYSSTLSEILKGLKKCLNCNVENLSLINSLKYMVSKLFKRATEKYFRTVSFEMLFG
jgi:triphosphoribosyl-dephospho-CoA synthetase